MEKDELLELLCQISDNALELTIDLSGVSRCLISGRAAHQALRANELSQICSASGAVATLQQLYDIAQMVSKVTILTERMFGVLKLNLCLYCDTEDLSNEQIPIFDRAATLIWRVKTRLGTGCAYIIAINNACQRVVLC